MAKHFTYTFKVRQKDNWALPFPIDMLRYDACRPASESDSSSIIRSFDHGPRVEPVEIRHERPSTAFAAARWEPTNARWESFGWEVVPGSLTRRET